MFIAKLTRMKDLQEETDMKLEDKIDLVISQINTNFLDLSYEESLNERLTERFDEVDRRLDKIDGRLDGIDSSIVTLKDDMNERFDKLESKFGRLENLVREINGKL